MGSRKKVTEPTPQDYHDAVMVGLNHAVTRIAGMLEHKAGKAQVETALSIIHKDLQYVVGTVRDIDNRTKEMKHAQQTGLVQNSAGHWMKPLSIPESQIPPFQGGNIPLGAAPLCAKCNAHRDANVHINEGFIGYHEYVPTANKPEDRSGVVSGGFPRQGFPQLNPMQDIHERLLKLAELERLMDERITNVARGAATVGTTELLVTRVVQLEKSHVTLGDAYLRRIEKLERRYSELVGKNQELEARVSAVLERLSLEKRNTKAKKKGTGGFIKF